MKRLLMIAGLMIAGFAVIQLGLAADAPERSSPQATTWEYRSVEGGELLGLSSLPLNKSYNHSVVYQAAFNKLGAEGWEFSNRFETDTYLFKRAKGK